MSFTSVWDLRVPFPLFLSGLVVGVKLQKCFVDNKSSPDSPSA